MAQTMAPDDDRDISGGRAETRVTLNPPTE
jgi:hypothetical protein